MLYFNNALKSCHVVDGIRSMRELKCEETTEFCVNLSSPPLCGLCK